MYNTTSKLDILVSWIELFCCIFVTIEMLTMAFTY